jgi:hypothetical protein
LYDSCEHRGDAHLRQQRAPEIVGEARHVRQQREQHDCGDPDAIARKPGERSGTHVERRSSALRPDRS